MITHNPSFLQNEGINKQTAKQTNKQKQKIVHIYIEKTTVSPPPPLPPSHDWNLIIFCALFWNHFKLFTFNYRRCCRCVWWIPPKIGQIGQTYGLWLSKLTPIPLKIWVLAPFPPPFHCMFTNNTPELNVQARRENGAEHRTNNFSPGLPTLEWPTKFMAKWICIVDNVSGYS